MTPHILNPEPLLGIHFQYLRQEALKPLPDILRQLVLSEFDLVVEVGGVGVFEGEIAAHHSEEDDAGGPDVGG